MNKTDIWEIIGDALMIAFGIMLVYVFFVVEVMGQYGMENNRYIRWFELFMGLPIIGFGIFHIIRDLRR